jgi:8-oxo-dGTP pyrophosphatase MutT (NUDIX family)
VTDLGPIAADLQELRVPLDGQLWSTSWHPPPVPPDGTPHGAQALCMTEEGDVVIVTENGESWGFPGGRPEAGESWEQTMRREVVEEACVTPGAARLLGYTRGTCIEGHEQGLTLVRSLWWVRVVVQPWRPRFEMTCRRIVARDGEELERITATDPFAPIVRRMLHEGDASALRDRR